MTNDNTMIGGGVVTTTLTTAPTSLKLRNPTPSKQDVLLQDALEDALLVHEEDKLMHDEEITSVESNEVDLDDMDEEPENDVEQTLINVALVKSLADDRITDIADDGSKQILVRKRGRPSAQETVQSLMQSANDGMALSRDQPPPRAVIPSTLTPLTSTVAAASRRNVRIKTDSLVSSRLLRSAPAAPGRQRLPSISESSVPNPLLNDIPSTIEEASMILPSKIKKEDSTDSFFPCPVSALSDEPASISVETPIPSTDCSRKVNFTADTSSMASHQRMRGLSIDFDLGLEFPDDSSASVGGGTSDMHSVGGGGNSRNRAYSFECFAFGINADEPLPPLEQSTSNAALVYNSAVSSGPSLPHHSDHSMGRPRGDSIIFDPVSFQDGGILEQHALTERPSATVVPKEVTTTVPAPPRPLPTPMSAPSMSTTTTSSKAAFPECKELSGESNAATVAASTTAALTLELLNKDGRIGIYLPEARRARIARFHAKRSKRIWRKRIKYDCRKKLADSRPRIKGRFVKRSDMDEDF